MKKIASLFLTVFFVSCSINQANASGKFSVKSADVEDNGIIANHHIFDGFGCSGKNISPQISWENAPKGTKSFAFTVYDPDAPTGSGWWHWILVNIPADYSKLPRDFGVENSFNIKDGISQIRNDFGFYKFGGPCPPEGHKPHRYIFTIYALKTDKIDLSKDSTAALAGFMINKNVLSKASFEARYGR